MPKTLDEIVNALQAPTPSKEIKYLPQSIDKEHLTALALPYVDARFIQDRLDEACGVFGWQTQIEDIGGFLCVGIGIFNPDKESWVWRWDTGQDKTTEETDWDEKGESMTSGGKSVVSRGIKRAAVQLGIARDIYDLPKRRLPIKPLNAKQQFTGWDRTRKPGERPESSEEETTETEGAPEGAPKPNPKTSTYPPEYVEFQAVAKTLKWSPDEINSVAAACKNPETGRVDYVEALRRAKAQVPPEPPF